ncbi:MAG: hypothetical protein R3B92_02740 [Patescibacteria group bacterium]
MKNVNETKSRNQHGQLQNSYQIMDLLVGGLNWYKDEPESQEKY